MAEMSECFFCGPTASPLTEEHVWPQWASRLFRAALHGDTFRQLRAAGNDTTANWESRYIDVTTKTVCAKCNNEWLSDLENELVKPIATPMIDGHSTSRLTATMQSVLAAWAYKMALLFEVANPDMPVHFFKPHERLLFRQTTEAHPFVRVFLARYDSKGHPAHSATVQPVYSEAFGARRTLDLRISTFTVGSLAMQVMAVRPVGSDDLIPASEMEFEFEGKARRAILPIWPAPSAPLAWPPPESMDGHDLDDFTTMWNPSP